MNVTDVTVSLILCVLNLGGIIQEYFQTLHTFETRPVEVFSNYELYMFEG
jgi:hypothetical protein